MTDSAGNTYTLISAANSSAVSATLAYCVNASALASGASVTANFPSSRNAAMRVRSVGGMATSSAFDVSAINASGSGTSASVGPTSATSQADELIYAVFAYQNSRTFTAGSGYTAGAQTESTTTIRGVVAEWKIVSTTGAQTPDGTWNTSATYAAVVATFKGATATAKSASDMGALSEASSLAASASASDSAAGSDASSLAVSASPADSGSASDASAVTVTITVTDAGSLGESASAVNLGTVVTTTDTGTLSDMSSLSAVSSPTDSGAGTDASSLAASTSRTDAATFSEAAQIGIGRAESESGSGTEASSLAAALSRTESGTWNESGVVSVVVVLLPAAIRSMAVPTDVAASIPAVSRLFQVRA